ncbi:hypothetical protein IW152_005196, partial [Coemansia sp. BCRC 34962]
PERPEEVAPLDEESPELSESESEPEISLTESVSVDEDELLVLKRCDESLVELLPLLEGLADREEALLVLAELVLATREGSVMLGSMGCEGEGTAVLSKPSRPAGIDAG